MFFNLRKVKISSTAVDIDRSGYGRPVQHSCSSKHFQKTYLLNGGEHTASEFKILSNHIERVLNGQIRKANEEWSFSWAQD